MTKSEYMELLRESLKGFSRELQEEILEDYRQHFAEGEKQGKTEEEIVEELGSIQDMIRELSEMNADNSTETGAEADAVEAMRETGVSYAGSCRAIKVECDVADIEILKSEDGQIHVDYQNDGSEKMKHLYAFHHYEKNGIFYVSVEKNENGEHGFLGRIWSIHRESHAIHIAVRVPLGIEHLTLSSALGDVSICGLEIDMLEGNTANGDMSVRQIKVKKMELSTAVGSIDMEEIQAQTSEVSTASGDISGRSVCVQSLICETASGDIDVQAEAEKWQCNASSGDIVIHSTGPCRKLDLNTASGDIQLNLEKSGGLEADINLMSGDINIFWEGKRHNGPGSGGFRLGGGSCRASINSFSGDVEINAWDGAKTS